MLIRPIDYFLLVWFILAGLSTLYVAYDQFKNNPEPAVMKWGFVLITLYLGPVGLLMYVMADKEPVAGAHEEFIKPLWKQGIGSTIHCVAGDATGIILAAAITASLGLPMWQDVIIEYLAGFLFGLLIFQSLFMKSMMGGTYLQNVRKSFLPEFISMNAMMAGMAPVMVLLMMGRDMRAMDPTELVFWGVMSLGIAVGFLIAYPVNLWMVSKKMKHGLMTQRKGALNVNHAGHLSNAATGNLPKAMAMDSDADAQKMASTSTVAGEIHHDTMTSEKSADGRLVNVPNSERDPMQHHGAPAPDATPATPIHPILVHFPIALIFISVGADVSSFLFAQQALRQVAAWTLLAAAAGAAAAVLAGMRDMHRMPLAHAVHEQVHKHMRFGFTLAAAIGALALWRWLPMRDVESAPGWGYLTVAAIVLALTAYQGWLGGELVYAQGVGVKGGVPAGSKDDGDHHHEPTGTPSPTATQDPSDSNMNSMPMMGDGGKSDHAQEPAPMNHEMNNDQAGMNMQDAEAVNPASALTRPQVVSVALITLLMLAAGLVLPSFSVNMRLSLRDVKGSIMPPGMIMTYDTPGAAMLDMAAVKPREIVYIAPADAHGDTTLTPGLEGGVKIFDLETSIVRWTILPGVQVDAFTFNRQVPGPRIRVTEGDKVRINIKNSLPDSTTIHWHGLILPNSMDGPANITQAPIPAGGSFTYEFTTEQSGTYFYHSHDHSDRQQGLGLYGALIIDPKDPSKEASADKEYVIQLQEWLQREGLTYPSMPMEGGMPNYFTINGKAYPSTETIKMNVGETIKLRFIGSNNNFIHPMHVHGGPFTVVARDGEVLPDAARFKADTVNVGPGQRYDVIWKALRPGKWLVHCHIAHHTTNNNTETNGGGGLMIVLDVQP